MPSILSKLFMAEWNVPYNCYELGHTWTPFCSEAALEIGYIVFKQSIKLYLPLYLVNQLLIQRKYDRKSFEECFRSICRSSTFLGINAFLVILLFCVSRHVLGRFYYTLCAVLPSFLGSMLAILNERPSRRRALAFYVANIASETLYRIMNSRGYVPMVQNGEIWLFAAAISSLVFLYDTGRLQDPLIRFVFKLVIGESSKRTQQKMERKQQQQEEENPETIPENESKPDNSGILSRIRSLLLGTSNLPTSSSSHSSSSPSDIPFVEDILLSGLLKPFLIGWLGQVSARIIPRALSLRPGFFSQYLLNPSYLFSWQHTSYGLFLASFTATYRSVRRILAKTHPSSSRYHSALAAMVASPSALIAPSPSVSTYLLWKCIEAFFNLATKNGYIPFQNFVVHMIYALSTAQLFYAAVLEPKFIKPSYQRFLDRVTENRLHNINRNVLEVFGTNSAAGYESFIPNYELKYTTKRFQESVLVWLL